jgi:hypothetical protein
MAEYQVATREEAIERYKDWLLNKIESGDTNALMALAHIKTVLQKHGYVNLVCYCKPQSCHGDIIKEIFITEEV